MKRYCIVAADAGRARIYTIESHREETAPPPELVEIETLVNPQRRQRSADLFTNSRPGLKREGPNGPAHGVDDHRDQQRARADRKFAASICRAAERAVSDSQAKTLVLAASPRLLGLIRGQWTQAGQVGLQVHELAKDLTGLTRPELQDYLSERALVPARTRILC